MLLDTSHITTDTIQDALLIQKHVSLKVLRLDKIHPIVSGNKLFKLNYFLEEIICNRNKTVVTFGGSYSNHLVACAYACKVIGIKSIGLIRGEKPATLSHTLQNCLSYGMELKYLSRKQYSEKDTAEFAANILNEYTNNLLIPEGGFHPKGALGAALIMNFIEEQTTHICAAMGTTTTIAGLLLGAKAHQQIIGIAVLKAMKDIEERLSFLKITHSSAKKLFIADQYHFGGYAKKNAALVTFMNTIFQQHHLPTDFVYTAKMMYGIFDLINSNYFPEGSKIVCVHTGGLQGNFSLPEGSLTFK